MAVKSLLLFMLLVLSLSIVHGQDPFCRAYPSGGNGKCVPIRQCSKLNTIRRKSRKTTADVDLLRKSVCSLKPTITVCCELPKVPGLPTDCGSLSGGSAIQDFIVGGEDASWWPWIALLFGRDNDNTTTHFCGGSLINKHFVITAAHCISDDFPLDFVRLGELDIRKNPDTYQGRTAPEPQDIGVAKIIIHPQYQKPRWRCSRCNDVALLKLNVPVDYNSFVGPICLPLDIAEMGYSDSRFEGEEATAAGWGKTTTDIYSHDLADHLQQIHIPIKTTPWCNKRVRDSSLPDGSIICAGSGDGKDTCRGDSGGPLMLTNTHGTKHYLVGISSFGNAICGFSDSQGVYSRVTHYLSWIIETIGSHLRN